MTIRLVVGLGNPGKSYARTRHNLGFMAVERFAEVKGWTFKEDRTFRSKIAKGVVGEGEVALLMPQTYMNLSGEAVYAYCSYFKVVASEVLVVVDDVSLPFGALRLRPRGSSGGHNGLKSVEESLRTDWYPRLRLGIGSEAAAPALRDHVLTSFTEGEREELSSFVQRAAEAIERLLEMPLAEAMNRINGMG